MKLKTFILFFIGAGLLACSSVREVSVESESIPVNNEVIVYNSVDSIIEPYRDSLEQEMEERIAFAEKSFEAGRPNGTLNNWASDVVFNSMRDTLAGQPVFCLLNVGGLRNTINKGPVTVGDIFRVMPFDNEIVAVRLPKSALLEIEAYILEKKGEPIAAATFENGRVIMLNADRMTDYFWVVTSDYLMNGGDNMDFFTQKTEVIYADILMRDAMLEAARKSDTLDWSHEERIKF